VHCPVGSPLSCVVKGRSQSLSCLRLVYGRVSFLKATLSHLSSLFPFLRGFYSCAMATNALILFFIIYCSVIGLSAAAMHVPLSSTDTTEELALSSSRTKTLRSISQPSRLRRQDNNDKSVCGGDASLFQCGAPFPSDFCCPTSTKCLQMDSSAMAVLCCPAGLDCNFISPISCDEQAQNATMFPGNQLHSDPTIPLDKCGDACCPSGATCHEGVCAVSISTATPSTKPTSTLAASPQASTSSTRASVADVTSTISLPAESSQSSNTLDGIAVTGGSSDSTSDKFSGKSFVAGLLPGIVLGACIVALLMWFLDRRRRRSNRRYPDNYTDQKHFSTADQLTSLSTDSHRTLPTHTRSISEPISDPSNGHRTDFVRSTPSPPRDFDPLNHNAGNYIVTASGPMTPARTPKIRALFSRSSVFHSPPSPQMSQFPSHMKRGTLNHTYTISPIRALRSKKSSHSLRRQMTASAAVPHTKFARSQNQDRPRAPAGGSTETIQVSMPQVELEACTPDQRTIRSPAEVDSSNTHGTARPTRDLNTTWTTVSSSPLYPEPMRLQQRAQQTPTRVPASQARTATQALGASRSQQRLMVQPDLKRQTTFSGFMEKAGVRPGVG